MQKMINKKFAWKNSQISELPEVKAGIHVAFFAVQETSLTNE